LLLHSFASGDVLNPHGIKDDVWNLDGSARYHTDKVLGHSYLDQLHAVDALENCVKKGDLFDYERLLLRTIYIDAIADIVWMFDK